MVTQRDLLLSILALDAYNQGYDENYKHGKTQIGSARLVQTASETDEQAAGFSASHYVIGSGKTAETVIAFRGTDDALRDAVNGRLPCLPGSSPG